jgi:hypothetical protein
MTMFEQPPSPFAVPPRPRRNLVPILIAALAVAVAAVIILGVLLTAGGGSDETPGGATDSFTLTGSFALTDGATEYVDQGECAGDGGYDDIAEGTQVTVYSSTGEVLATGSLGTSVYAGGVCEFEITVKSVPSGHDFYQVEVSHRGKIAVSDKEARAGATSLTLG